MKIMDYRRRKQAIIVAILSFIFLLILSGVYFKWIYAEPTCADGKKNQGETDIDCGGPCLSCERLTIKDLSVDWVQMIPLKGDSYDLAAKIINGNPNFGLGSFRYSFRLYDKDGKQVKSQSGSSFILPSRSKYLIEGNIEAPNAVRVELVIQNPDKDEWQQLVSEYEDPNIYVQDKQFKYLEDQSAKEEASGVVKNASGFDFDQIIISIILFDKDRKVLGVNKTDMRTVMAGEERFFSALWFTPIAGQVASADMQAETNLFSDANFMRRYGSQERFQEMQTETNSF